MERMDRDMPFLLQYEHVAWFEKGKVRILDRRVYPTEVRFRGVHGLPRGGTGHRGWVTQSAGPYTAVGMGMALAAWQVRDKAHGSRRSSCGRRPMTWHTPGLPPPTGTARSPAAVPMWRRRPWLRAGSGGGHRGIHCGVPEPPVQHHAGGRGLSGESDPQWRRILTQCFGETIIGTVIRAARRQNKTFRLLRGDTALFTGGRLTSSCFAQMGIDTTVLTDNMIAYAMEREASTSSPQRRTPSPGTAISPTRSALSRSPSWPSVSGCPTMSPASRTGRSGRRTTSSSRCGTPPKSSLIGGSPTRSPGEGHLPSFDVVPPHLISGVVTDKGVYVPYLLGNYFDSDVKPFY